MIGISLCILLCLPEAMPTVALHLSLLPFFSSSLFQIPGYSFFALPKEKVFSSLFLPLFVLLSMQKRVSASSLSSVEAVHAAKRGSLCSGTSVCSAAADVAGLFVSSCEREAYGMSASARSLDPRQCEKRRAAEARQQTAKQGCEQRECCCDGGALHDSLLVSLTSRTHRCGEVQWPLLCAYVWCGPSLTSFFILSVLAKDLYNE